MAERKRSATKPSRTLGRPRSTRVAKKQASPFQEFFRLGESYTSLVLGIVVVIAAAWLLVSFTKSRVTPHQKPRQDISSTSTARIPTSTTIPLQQSEAQQTATITPYVTRMTIPSKAPTVTPTVAKLTTTSTVVPTKSSFPTVTIVTSRPTVTPAPATSGKTYTVKAGDDLWNIAVRAYGDGYQWSSIAKANNLYNPNVILAGTTLTLPARTQAEEQRNVAGAQMTPKPSVNTPQVTTGPPAGSIAGTSYSVQRGDTLWDIAVRAYGNGYRWVEIAKINHLTMPGTIHHGNVLTIPR